MVKILNVVHHQYKTVFFSVNYTSVLNVTALFLHSNLMMVKCVTFKKIKEQGLIY